MNWYIIELADNHSESSYIDAETETMERELMEEINELVGEYDENEHR